MDEKPLAATEETHISGIGDIKRKMHFTGSVMKTTLAGAVVDIGFDTPGVLHISQLKKEPVNRVEDVIHVGQTVEVWVRRVEPKKGRIELTMIEPLSLEWRDLSPDMVVKGNVVRIEKWGVFVDIGAERPGLVHVSEMTHDYIRDPRDMVKEGDEVEAKVLGINRRKKQIKLSMKALEEKPVKAPKPAPRGKAKKAEAAIEPEEQAEAVPTAMEIAYREAMERSKEGEREEPRDKRKFSGPGEEMEQILSRTLEQKVRTATK